jgi:predicted nucleic acid-binding Zn ribbon protein
MLEQWELDLRNQLGNAYNNKSINWEDQLINDLPKEIVNKPKKKKTNFTLIMLIAIIFLGITTLFVFNHKTKFIENLAKKELPKDPAPNVEIVELHQKIEELEEKQKELEKRLALQSDKISASCDKVTLLGVLFNENAVILKDNLDKRDLMTIDRGWQIKKMPQHLKLEENDEKFLKKHIK